MKKMDTVKTEKKELCLCHKISFHKIQFKKCKHLMLPLMKAKCQVKIKIESVRKVMINLRNLPL